MGRAAYVQASFRRRVFAGRARPHRSPDLSHRAQCLPQRRADREPAHGSAAAARGSPGSTRGGLAAKLIGFDFEQPFPYQIEISAGFFRYWSEVSLVTTNDDATIAAISGANPAVITTTAAHGWSTGNQARVASNVKLLLRRDLAITVLSPTTFSIADAVTGTAIDGGALEAFTAGTVSRIAETATPYTGDLWRTCARSRPRPRRCWSTARSRPTCSPSRSSRVTPPSPSSIWRRRLSRRALPRSDPRELGDGQRALRRGHDHALVPALHAAKAYNIGDYVTSGGQGYKSRVANNQGHTPASSPTQWRAVNAGDPINDGAGFTAADIGRLIRLFSEPPLWTAAASYSAGQIVTYDGRRGQTYYAATGAITPNLPPGTSLSWSILTGASVARWTWGRILSVSASGITAPDSFRSAT
jgi:hypothetical protein